MDNLKKNGIDLNELIKKASQNNGKNMDSEQINSFIEENLSSSQASAVKELLKDEEKTKAILNSDAAKSLFQKLFGGGNNG